MAQRRMFSPDIVGSDAFIEMPISTQALYFHLGMYADDDGFVNPKKIMRMIGLSEDDLKVLISKRFVLSFENGVIVIKHWKVNNLVRKDWYKETVYIEQKNQIKTKENGVYTEFVNETAPKPLTNRQHRLGKVRLGNTLGESSPDNKLKDITMGNIRLDDDSMTYSDETSPKKPKGRTRLYARIAIDYLKLKGEGGDVIRYFKDIKELVAMTEAVLKSEGYETTDENIIKSIHFRFAQADKKFTTWGFGAIIKNFNNLAK